MIRWLVMLYILPLIFFGCKTPGTSPQGPSPQVSTGSSFEKIDRWIHNDLLPVLVKKITKNPNLKGKAFTIAGWDVEKNSIKAGIDTLTKEIIESISSELRKYRGIDYVPRSPIRPLDLTHQERLVDLHCDEYRHIEWYLLLTVRINKLTGKLSLTVHGAFPERVYFKNVPGLSMDFECDVSQKVLTLLSQSKTDEYLRGLRYLPFDESQKDLLAAYLARRVSCIFKDMSGGDEFVVFVDQSNAGINSFFRETFHIIELYLDQFREIKMTSDRSKADVVMTCEAISISGDLCQVWLTAKEANGKGGGIGASTAAYLKKKII